MPFPQGGRLSFTNILKKIKITKFILYTFMGTKNKTLEYMKGPKGPLYSTNSNCSLPFYSLKVLTVPSFTEESLIRS